MTDIQKEIVKLIHFMLNSEYFRNNYASPGLKDIISQAIRQYPEITTDKKRTWKNVEMYLAHLKISERAEKVITENPHEEELWKLLHYEHIEPVSVTLNRLIELGGSPSLNDVREVMFDCEVFILSKEEANVLDGSKTSRYELDGELVLGKGMRASGTKEERLSAVGIRIAESYKNNKL